LCLRGAMVDIGCVCVCSVEPWGGPRVLERLAQASGVPVVEQRGDRKRGNKIEEPDPAAEPVDTSGQDGPE
jgi:hypothetical protein